MAQVLTFPVQPDGLRVDVLINLHRQALAALQAGGQPVPPPARCRGLLDTGSDVTAVGQSVLRALALKPAFQRTTHTAAGPLPVNLFEVSLGITDIGAGSASMLVEPHLYVMELTTALPDVDVLVGLDVLLGCRLLLDGPGRTFTLEF